VWSECECFVPAAWLGCRLGGCARHAAFSVCICNSRLCPCVCCRVNYELGGLEPFWFHACNVALHTVASVLFTRVCLAVAGLRPHFAATAGALFAAHPIHTEAVSSQQNIYTHTSNAHTPALCTIRFAPRTVADGT